MFGIFFCGVCVYCCGYNFFVVVVGVVVCGVGFVGYRCSGVVFKEVVWEVLRSVVVVVCSGVWNCVGFGGFFVG